MPPAQAGTALAERAGEAGHHERDRGAAGHPHRSTTPRSRMEGHTTVPELGHGSPLRLENGIGVGRRWSARRVSGGGVAGSGRDRGRAFRRSAAVRRGHGDLRGGDQRGLPGVESGSHGGGECWSRGALGRASDRPGDAHRCRLALLDRNPLATRSHVGRPAEAGRALEPPPRYDAASGVSHREHRFRGDRASHRERHLARLRRVRDELHDRHRRHLLRRTRRARALDPERSARLAGEDRPRITSWPRPPFPFCSDRSSSRGRSTAMAASAWRRHSARRSISEPTESSPSPCAIRPTGTQTYT